MRIEPIFIPRFIRHVRPLCRKITAAGQTKIFNYVCSPSKPTYMALIKSISGIRGTIGGKPGDTLSPLDVVRFTAAYGTWL
ncbi:hypothetical protein NL346_26815, partial [Klebsiella pneumoniae]|nr:hypothetical protein [Klebsiella pneumoniae]